MLARLNPHLRDARISFCDPWRVDKDGKRYRDHYYVVDGEVWRNVSATAMKARYFPENFNAHERSRGNVELQQKWARDNEELRVFGVFHHRHFENYANGEPFEFDPAFPQYTCYEDLPGWAHFMAFLQSLEPWWVFFRTEWPIFSKEAKLPGMIDLVMRDSRFPDELILMVVDYKMRKDPTALPFCSCGAWGATLAYEHAEDCSAVGGRPASRGILRRKCDVDSFQTCIYTKILEDLYGAIVTKMVLAYLHPGTVANPYPMYLHVVDKAAYNDLIADAFESRLINT